MKLIASVIRFGRNCGPSILLLAGIFVLGTTLGFSSNPNSERIQSTYYQGGNAINITLTIYDYTTPSEMLILSQAFEEGKDQGLTVALSKTKAAGNCSITGELGFDVAFIQSIETPTGRQITFITNRPMQADKGNPSAESQPFDLMVGQFELNDTDNTKSTGFLYPASKLVLDDQEIYHYDLAGSPWSLVNVLDSKWDPVLAEDRAPDAVLAASQHSRP
jgi:hypothetical protein